MATTSPLSGFGRPAPAFDLVGTDNKRHTVDTVRGKNGLLVMFICNHCPYVKAVLDKLVRDARDLAALGVGSVAICSNDAADYPEDSFDNMAALSERMRFPDFFGFNGALELQYRGRLDDAGRSPKPDAPRELYQAMVEVSRTGKGPARQVASVGCSIKWRDAA
jgi:hypothetical protein